MRPNKFWRCVVCGLFFRCNFKARYCSAPPCRRAYLRAYQAKHPGRIKTWQRKADAKRLRNETAEQRETRLTARRASNRAYRQTPHGQAMVKAQRLRYAIKHHPPGWAPGTIKPGPRRVGPTLTLDERRALDRERWKKRYAALSPAQRRELNRLKHQRARQRREHAEGPSP